MKLRSGDAFTGSVALLLSGPVIGAAHFVGLYLFAEAACVAGWLDTRVLGMHGITLVTVVATIVAAAATLALARAGYARREDKYGGLPFIGSMLGVLFAIEILFVGVSVAFLEPC